MVKVTAPVLRGQFARQQMERFLLHQDDVPPAVAGAVETEVERLVAQEVRNALQEVEGAMRAIVRIEYV